MQYRGARDVLLSWLGLATTGPCQARYPEQRHVRVPRGEKNECPSLPGKQVAGKKALCLRFARCLFRLEL